MQTKSTYEEIVLKELRELPIESLPQVIKILRSIKRGIAAARQINSEKVAGSGFCGAWQDSKSAEEIILEIHSHRTGFGGRRIEL